MNTIIKKTLIPILTLALIVTAIPFAGPVYAGENAAPEVAAAETAEPVTITEDMVSFGTDTFSYSGTIRMPSVTVTNPETGEALIKDTDYTVTVPEGRILPGTYDVVITGIEAAGYTGTVTKSFTITRRALTSSNVKLSKTQYACNGKVRTPSVTVNVNGKTLTRGADKDYTVAYASGRKNVGTYKVTVKGVGNYSGTVTKTFKIVKGTQKVTFPKRTYSKKITSGDFNVKAKSSGTGTLKYSSTNKTVATVSKAGKVTIKGAGTTKIKVYAAANKNYKKSEVRTITVKVQTPKTTTAFKKYLGRWETPDYKLNVKVATKNYIKAVITTRQGDSVVLNRKVKDSRKTCTIHAVSKKGTDVTVMIRLRRGEPYRLYEGDMGIDGPELHITGDTYQWYQNDYYMIKNGKRVPAFLVYMRYI